MEEPTIIYAYTRADALKDGVLIDVSTLAREAGFVYPVAMTQALEGDIENIPQRLWGIASREGRLWDVVYLASWAARTNTDPACTTICYPLVMPIGRNTEYIVKMVLGPGDDGEPVITLMQPDES